MSERFHLSNGLTVVFQEQHAAPVAAFQVWIRAGSADERPDQAGSRAPARAHALQGQRAARSRRAGARSRGPGRRGERLDQLRRDRLPRGARQPLRPRGPRPRSAMRSAPRASIPRSSRGRSRWSARRSSAARTPRRVARAGCSSPPPTATTPTGVRCWAPSSSVRSFDAATHARVLRGALRAREHGARGGRRSHPARAARVGRGVPRWRLEASGAAAARVRTPEPERTGMEVSLKREAVREAWLHLALPAPPFLHPDAAALDLLAMIAGQGDTSRLVREVKRERALVNDIHLSAYTPARAGAAHLLHDAAAGERGAGAGGRGAGAREPRRGAAGARGGADGPGADRERRHLPARDGAGSGAQARLLRDRTPAAWRPRPATTPRSRR